MVLHILYIICALLVVLSIYFRWSYEGRLMAKIPGPLSLPLLGNFLSLSPNPVILFKDMRTWRKKYGRVWKFAGGSLRAVHLYHPEDVEKILSTTRYNYKSLPYSLMRSWLGEGLLTSNGDKWHKRRKMLTPAFHFNILNKFFTTFSEHTQDFLDTIEQETRSQQTDLIPLIAKATLLMMCDTSLGTKLQKDAPSIKKYLHAIHKIGACITERLSLPILYPAFIYNLSSIGRREKAIVPVLHNFTKELIDKKRNKRKENDVIVSKKERPYNKRMKPAFLDLLLDEEDKGTIDYDGIREEVDTFLFEGHDTTATALNFMIMRIANEPEIQNKIYEELRSIFGDFRRPAVLGDLSEMKYLECCIKESMRLYPSVPFMSRYSSEETVIAGYTIPKNTYFDIHTFDIHRDPDVYPEPEKFIPERFLPENAIKRNPYSYIPFSAGPRNCIGQKFALMELKTLMCGLLRRYRLEAITRPEDLVFSADLVLRTNHPIYVRFRSRENNCKRS